MIALVDIWDALDLDAGTETGAPAVVAIAGGGGKTSLLYRLGREAAARGLRAVLAGTTRFTPAPGGRMPPLLRGTESALTPSVQAALHTEAVVVASPTREPEGRLAAISSETACAIAAIKGLGLLALEADGSKLRPFKAPAEHEPVVPPCATHLVTVVGADAIDAPLDERHVHRPERVRAIAGASAAICDIPLLALVLASPDGGRRHAEGRQFAVLVNKAELAPEGSLELARALREEGVPRVVVASLRDEEQPVRELFASTSARSG